MSNKLPIFQQAFKQGLNSSCPENIKAADFSSKLSPELLNSINNAECKEYVFINTLFNDFSNSNPLDKLANDMGISNAIGENIGKLAQYLYTCLREISNSEVKHRWNQMVSIGLKPQSVFNWKYDGNKTHETDARNAAFNLVTDRIPELKDAYQVLNEVVKVSEAKTTKGMNSPQVLTQLSVLTFISKIVKEQKIKAAGNSTEGNPELEKFDDLSGRIKAMNLSPLKFNFSTYVDGITFVGKATKDLLYEKIYDPSFFANSTNSTQFNANHRWTTKLGKDGNATAAPEATASPTTEATASATTEVTSNVSPVTTEGTEKDTDKEKGGLWGSFFGGNTAHNSPTEDLSANGTVNLATLGAKSEQFLTQLVAKFTKTGKDIVQEYPATPTAQIFTALMDKKFPTLDALQGLKSDQYQIDEWETKVVQALLIITFLKVGGLSAKHVNSIKTVDLTKNCFNGKLDGKIYSVDFREIELNNSGTEFNKIDLVVGQVTKMNDKCQDVKGEPLEMLRALEMDDTAIELTLE